jgi:phosphonoacetaldehyde hydrolase
MKRIKATIFDWAGTTIDYGCMAPTVVFKQMFDAYGVPISTEEARGPMGTHKKEHLRLLLQNDSIAARWEARHGQRPGHEALEHMFTEFVPVQRNVILNYTSLIPGTVETMAYLRSCGIKVGTTTGYLRSLMELVVPEAAKLGYCPDNVVCSDEVALGRPAPWMCLSSCELLNVYPLGQVVKVDDTVTGLEEGIHAGMWTIGLAKTGNEMGLSEQEVADLEANDPKAYRERLGWVYEKLYRAGADYVVDGIWDVPMVIESINEKMNR